VTITTGITNHEGTTSIYNIQIKLNDQVIGQDGPLSIGMMAAGTSWLTIHVEDDQQVIFILEKEGHSSPYWTLRLCSNGARLNP
jgi:hypothetical protein